ncbi:MAG TPA: hypothetical protein VIV11_07650, partial [Kofleriaceae bacterium]
MRGRIIGLLILVACKSSSPQNDDAGPDPNGLCGNGVVDDNETCDGTCEPCDDFNACTVDTQSGAAETCDLVCTREPISACGGGDGCCPASCNNASDSDCSASCGDGNIDMNETCDPPGTCPTTCNDGNTCTTDLLTGSSANCNAACSTSSITMCTAGDGCCPNGCTSVTDADCNPSCGNGVVEAGETCDPKSTCPTSCNDSNACTQNVL